MSLFGNTTYQLNEENTKKLMTFMNNLPNHGGFDSPNNGSVSRGKLQLNFDEKTNAVVFLLTITRAFTDKREVQKVSELGEGQSRKKEYVYVENDYKITASLTI